MPPPKGTTNPLEGPGDYTVTTEVHSDTYPGIDPRKLDLSGKAVFVSGASRGIGAQIVISFARAGASYIALGARSGLDASVASVREAAREANRPEPQILPVQVDISNVQSVEAAAAKVKESFGRLDILVNNAGVMTELGPLLLDTDPEQWWAHYEVNVKGPYLMLRSFIPLLIGTQDGLKTAVTVASVGGLISTPGVSGYQSSKWSVLKLADHVMAEYGDKGLVMFSVHPGNILTPMAGEGMPEHLQPGRSPHPPLGAMASRYDARKHQTANRSSAFVDNVQNTGDALAFLTSEKRDWLGGRYVNLTWDMPELVGSLKEKIIKNDMLKVKLVV